MKKKFRLAILVLALIGIIAPAGSVFAGTLTQFTASTEDGKIIAEGKAADGVYAVQVFVYNEAGTELVASKSTAVNADNTFKDTIEVPEGTFLVKAADYAGGEFLSMTVKASDTTTKEPGTGDNTLLITFAFLGTASMLTILTMTAKNRKR
ncbi:MAG: hypothetical protein E7241_02715 [Lachnospiraceae bacterium]|jgi:hypothetical protein|nr:hypothetical protein [Lachnospiraceae bacterium]